MPSYLKQIINIKNLSIIFVILILASVAGLVSNALRKNSLPLLRKPLKETRATVKIVNMMGSEKNPVKPNINTDKPAILPKQPNRIETKTTTTKNTSNSQVSKPEKKNTTVKSANQALFTTLKDAKSLFDSKSALFVDARPDIDYDAGHIPGAVSLYLEDFDRLYEIVFANIPKNRIIITYCSDPECRSATELADKLVSRGHLRVFIMIDGIPGWKDAGYPLTESKENVNVETN